MVAAVAEVAVEVAVVAVVAAAKVAVVEKELAKHPRFALLSYFFPLYSSSFLSYSLSLIILLGYRC